jgi:hypothetical protein
VQLVGSVELSDDAGSLIEAAFDWKPVSRNEIPGSLARILPSGDLVFSERLNESFSDNPTFAHGLMVRLDAAEKHVIFFLARDIDHPIK